MLKHVFIINPAAGSGQKIVSLLPKITYACEARGIEYTIYHTRTVGDATRYVREKCTAHPENTYRFYACGGDGTLNEVANGAALRDNAQVGVIPIGTGNDFVRSFTSPEGFSDISRQLAGTVHKIDMIKFGSRWAINEVNIGFDCDVVCKVNEIKRKPFLKGSMAYYAGVGLTFAKKLDRELDIVCDGTPYSTREVILVAFGNGSYYGGGFKMAPLASLRDGYMDMCLADKVSRGEFVKALAAYKSGKFIDDLDKYSFIHCAKCKKVELRSPFETGFCVDGEIFPFTSLTLECVSDAVSVVLPAGTEFASSPTGEKAADALTK